MGWTHQARMMALPMILLTACGKAPVTADARTPSSQGRVAAGLAETTEIEALRARAQQALQAGKLFAPEGDNALELYLRLRKRTPTDPGVQAALEDLQPQLVIAVEQAIANGRYATGGTLIGLLEQLDARAPALPRLRVSVASAQALAQARESAVDVEDQAKIAGAEAELRRVAQAAANQLAEQAKNPASKQVTSTTLAAPPLKPTIPPPSTFPNESAVTQGLPGNQPTQAQDSASERARPSPDPIPHVAVAPPQSEAARKPLRLIREVAPRYPPMAVASRRSGEVQVAFTVNAQGDVESPRVVTSNLPNAFERAAILAASRWQFEATGNSHSSMRTVRFDPPDS